MLFKSFGQLQFSQNPTKLILEVDPELQKYYFNQIPKYFKPNKTKYSAHVSIIRGENAVDLGPFHHRWIEFEYEPYIYEDEKYFWLSIVCPHLKQIRIKCGLKSLKFGVTYSPNGQHEFHMTIANKINNGYQKISEID